MDAISAIISLILLWPTLTMADAPGAPGIPHRWPPAAKEAIGSSYEPEGASSPVWFTVSQGILTEVFYPTVDQAQVGDLQFLVTDGSGFFSDQKRDTQYQVQYVDEGLTVHISGEDRSGRYSYEQWIVTDSASPVVRIHTTFHWNQSGLRLFFLFKPAIGNSGADNLVSASRDGLFASKGISGESSVTAALVASTGFSTASAGYVGFSDGWQDISKNFKITAPSTEAGPGNVALTGELPVGAEQDISYDLALSFGTSENEAQTYAQTSLSVPFSKIQESYESGWKNYLRELQENSKNTRFITESALARRSAQIIKMHEDKLNRGAIVASLSNPAIPDSDNALDGVGGYHLVWPRDLYHAATALLAAGDPSTPAHVLKYLEKIQHPDGSWSQNSWVDGSPYWRGLQMDEVSFPILLASLLKFQGISNIDRSDLDMVRRAATFIVSHGPTTQEDRWEEIGGYVPATIAAEIAALRAASALSQDPSFADVATQWQSFLERWTLVKQGKWGNNYYLRASSLGQPENPDTLTLANGAGSVEASEMIDGGFLELVRLGVRPANDPRILSTLRIYDDPATGLAQSDPNSPDAKIYRRYNHDAYGYGHSGGFWPLLAGERGEYSVASGDLDTAAAELFVLEKTAAETGLIPEQVVAAPSENVELGLGVAQPLVWAHAEDILLHRGIEEGRIFDAPRTQ